VVIALNILLMGLECTPWFGGTDLKPGGADQLFGTHRLGGFQVDFLWLIFSTAIIFLASFAFLFRIKRSPSARIDVLLCLAEILAFVLFVFRMLTTGLLDFG